MPPPKESWLRYMKFSKSGKSGTKRSSTNLRTKATMKHNRTCVTLQETLNERDSVKEKNRSLGNCHALLSFKTY
jgi:hypothetical protein